MHKHESLHSAYMKFVEEKNQQAYEEFLFNFFLFAKESHNVHIPVELEENGQMNYGLVNTTEGYFFVVCTDANELIKCPEKSSVVGFLDKILLRMLNDDEIKGICVNPYGALPCFIPQDYAKRILEISND